MSVFNDSSDALAQRNRIGCTIAVVNGVGTHSLAILGNGHHTAVPAVTEGVVQNKRKGTLIRAARSGLEGVRSNPDALVVGAADRFHIDIVGGVVVKTIDSVGIRGGIHYSAGAEGKSGHTVLNLPRRDCVIGNPVDDSAFRGHVRSGDAHRSGTALRDEDGEVIHVPRSVGSSGGEADGDTSICEGHAREGERTVEHSVGAAEAALLRLNRLHSHEGGGVSRIGDVTHLNGTRSLVPKTSVIGHLQILQRIGECGQRDHDRLVGAGLQLQGVAAGMRSSCIVTINERGA